MIMHKLTLHRVEAKQALREKLSYKYITSLSHYSKLTREQYKLLVSKVETICLLILEAYFRGTNM